jgi:diguanylate cyclase (GGDEF)-like protein/PAS domain S-box-containing protein
MSQTSTPQDSVFRTLFETMGDPCFLCKKNGLIIDCNRAALRILGYPDKQSVLNRTPEELSPPFQPDGSDSHEKTIKMIKLASQMGAHHFEWMHLHANGTSIPVEVMLTRIVMDGEEMLHSLWRDLTSRKQAEDDLRKSETKLRLLFENTSDAVILYGSQGIFDCNKVALQIFGASTVEAFKKQHPGQLSPEKQPCGTDSFTLINANIERAMQTGHYRFEWLHQRIDNGQLFPAEVLLSPMELEGNPCIQATVRDISERKQTERVEKFRSDILELLTKELLLPHILEAVVLAVEQLLSDSLCSILLLDSSGKHLSHSIAPHLPDFYNEALNGLAIGADVASCGAAAYTGQLVIVEDIASHPFWTPYRSLAVRAELAACWSQPILSSTGKVLGTFAIYYRKPRRPASADISLINQAATLAGIAIERAKMEEQVLRLAYYDELTNLPNRRLLMDRLKKVLSANSRSGKHGALLFIDLDNFKTINDTLGHAAGDVMLHHVALRLVACVRHEDTVARLGGDEFVVMLEGLREDPTVAAEQATATSKKILAALRLPYPLNNKEQYSTPSIGAVVFKSKNELSAETLIKRADIAMYHAKEAGRNGIYFFDSQMEDRLTEKFSLANDLHDALERHQFELFYQIQIDQFGVAQGAEALIRWNHPTKGLVSPLQFIPLAEETGLIVPLGLWVLKTACAQLKAWQQHATTCDLTLAVNVSARQFFHPDFVSQVNTLVEQHAIDPRQLKLELTESLLATDVEGIIAKMHQLQSTGIRFSLDDFGTGYSSLQYIKRLPLAQLKIDQSFVRDIETNPQDRAIVRTIIATAKSFNLDVIAEGVETVGQKALLTAEGCFHFQGYLFSKPLPIAQFAQLLQDDFVT